MYLHILMVVTKNPIGQWKKYNRSVVQGIQKSNVCDHEIKPSQSTHTHTLYTHSSANLILFLPPTKTHTHTMSLL